MQGNTSALSLHLKDVCAILIKKTCINRNTDVLQVSKHTVPETVKIARTVAASVPQ